MNPTTDHVLLVDDDPEIRQLTAQYLEQNGLQCSTAASGREMRQLLRPLCLQKIQLRQNLRLFRDRQKQQRMLL